MNHLYSPLHRFAMRFTTECIAASGSAFFGCHVALARFCAGPHATSAFATILPPASTPRGETLLFIVLPLLAGATLQSYGACFSRRLIVLAGTLLEFFVYATALASCCLGNPWGTGVGAYTFIVLVVGSLFCYRALGIEWIPTVP